MKAYYINLARRLDRRSAMEERLGEQEIPFERIEATTPEYLSQELKDRYCDPAKRYWQTAPELCCSVSHLAALATFVRSGASHGLILEDDAVLSPFLKTFLDDFAPAPPAAGLVRIEADKDHMRLGSVATAQIGPIALHQNFGNATGAAAYVVSRKAAQRILAGTELLQFMTDQALFNPDQKLARELGVLQASPGLAVQEFMLLGAPDSHVGSDLAQNRRDRMRDEVTAFRFYRLLPRALDFWQRDVVGAIRKAWHKRVSGAQKREVPFLAR